MKFSTVKLLTTYLFVTTCHFRRILTNSYGFPKLNLFLRPSERKHLRVSRNQKRILNKFMYILNKKQASMMNHKSKPCRQKGSLRVSLQESWRIRWKLRLGKEKNLKCVVMSCRIIIKIKRISIKVWHKIKTLLQLSLTLAQVDLVALLKCKIKTTKEYLLKII